MTGSPPPRISATATQTGNDYLAALSIGNDDVQRTLFRNHQRNPRRA